MKNINFYSIPEIIKSGMLNFDGDKKDLRLHSQEIFNWGAETKKEYNKAAKAIDNINYKGEGWKIYAWYDISDFDYWMEKQQAQNYIQISISFEKGTVNENQIPLIYKSLDSALADADAIQNKYSFNPCLY